MTTKLDGHTADTVQRLLADAGYTVTEVGPIPYGIRVRCSNGSLVNVYDKHGTAVPQGRDMDSIRALLGRGPSSAGGTAEVLRPANPQHESRSSAEQTGGVSFTTYPTCTDMAWVTSSPDSTCPAWT